MLRTNNTENRSGTLSVNQLFGADEVPPVCGGYLPLDIQQRLAERDRQHFTDCPIRQHPCTALDEQTGECMVKACLYD